MGEARHTRARPCRDNPNRGGWRGRNAIHTQGHAETTQIEVVWEVGKHSPIQSREVRAYLGSIPASWEALSSTVIQIESHLDMLTD